MADAIVSGAISVCNTLHTCKLCGKGFYPKRTNNAKFCGRGCGLQWASFKSSVRSNGGRVWVRVNRCKPKPVRAVRTSEEWLWPQTIRPCATCGEQFVPQRSGGRFSAYCCVECRNRGRAATAKKGKAARRSKARAGAGADRIDPIRVFERDAWRCQICKRKTPRSKRGTHDPSAPELDHIVALANGGTHTWGNVQCACRVCNGRKGANDYGQLHLFPSG